MFYGRFLQLANVESEKLSTAYLGALVAALPEDRRNLLAYLCQFFHQIVDCSAENKMGAANLAIIFSPAFFGQYLTSDTSRIMAETKATSKVTQILIERFHKIFKAPHQPLQLLVAQDTFSEGGVSLLRGEELSAFGMEEGGEDCYFFLNGIFHRTTQEFLLKKCRFNPTMSFCASAKEPPAEEENAEREIALCQFLDMSNNSQRIAASTYINAGGKRATQERERILAENAAVLELKPTKGSLLRRKSSEVFGMGMRRREAPRDADEKKEKDPEKREKDPEKKFKKLPINWTSHTSHKSSSNFFGLAKGQSTGTVEKRSRLSRERPAPSSLGQKEIEENVIPSRCHSNPKRSSIAQTSLRTQSSGNVA